MMTLTKFGKPLFLDLFLGYLKVGSPEVHIWYMLTPPSEKVYHSVTVGNCFSVMLVM